MTCVSDAGSNAPVTPRLRAVVAVARQERLDEPIEIDEPAAMRSAPLERTRATRRVPKDFSAVSLRRYVAIVDWMGPQLQQRQSGQDSLRTRTIRTGSGWISGWVLTLLCVKFGRVLQASRRHAREPTLRGIRGGQGPGCVPRESARPESSD